MCRVAKEAGDHTVSIFTFTGKKKKLFHTCIVPWPLLQSTLFLHYSCPPGKARHTANLIKFATAICEIWASKISFEFLRFFLLMLYGGLRGLRFIFALCKNCYKMQMCNSIASIFGTNEERVTMDSHTKFVVNLSKIQGVMDVYSRKNRSNFCHGYRVNQV